MSQLLSINKRARLLTNSLFFSQLICFCANWDIPYTASSTRLHIFLNVRLQLHFTPTIKPSTFFIYFHRFSVHCMLHACLLNAGNVLTFLCLLTVWQKTTSRRYCTLRSMAMVGARSCMSRNTIDFFALSLIIATHSVSVVSRGYSASLHSPGTCMPTHTVTNQYYRPALFTVK